MGIIWDNLVKLKATNNENHFMYVSQLNARSVKNISSEIAEFIVGRDIDVYALTETWLSNI